MAAIIELYDPAVILGKSYKTVACNPKFRNTGSAALEPFDIVKLGKYAGVEINVFIKDIKSPWYIGDDSAIDNAVEQVKDSEGFVDLR